MYEEGKKMGWPGLWQEVSGICKEIGIPDINDDDIDVPVKDVKEAVEDHHHKHMMEEFEHSKKLKDIRYDNFREVQEYFSDKSVANGRMSFQIRTQMLPGIPGNFKNKFKNKKSGLR